MLGRKASPAQCPVVILIDLNCFYAQVETLKDPSIAGRPVGVYQKHIVVTSNYLARSRGVKKCASIKAARAACPELVLRNGENLDDYRKASDAFISTLSDCLCGTSSTLQKIGLDEAFIDVSNLVDRCINSFSREHVVGEDSLGIPETAPGFEDIINRFFPPATKSKISAERAISSIGWSVVSKSTAPGYEVSDDLAPIPLAHGHGLLESDSSPDHREASHRTFETVISVHRDDRMLQSPDRIACGAHICATLRSIVKEKLGFFTTAGIASSKTAAKLAASYLHQPDTQTALYPDATLVFLRSHPLRSIPRIGQATFQSLAQAGIESVADILACSAECLAKILDGNAAFAQYLILACRGLDFLVDPVVYSGTPKSISVEDSFSSTGGITRRADLLKTLRSLSERLLLRQLEHLRVYDEVSGTLKVSLRYQHDARRQSRQSTLPQCLRAAFDKGDKSTNSSRQLLVEAVQLVNRLTGTEFDAPRPIYVLNLSLSNFHRRVTHRTLTFQKKPVPPATSRGPCPLVRRVVRRKCATKRLAQHQQFEVCCVPPVEYNERGPGSLDSALRDGP